MDLLHHWHWIWKKKEVNKEVKSAKINANLKYKNKVEEDFTQGSLHSAWQGFKNMATVNTAPSTHRTIRVAGSGPASLANDLNALFSRFQPDSITQLEALVSAIHGQRHISPAMAALHSGPHPQEEFSQSFEQPEARGSPLSCDEGYGEGHKNIHHHALMDSHQCVYQVGRVVDDAKALIMDTVLKHLQHPTPARLLYADFSSTFNTPQPQRNSPPASPWITSASCGLQSSEGAGK